METGFTQVPNWALAKCNTALQRSVYVALAMRADNETGICWPSYSRIADDACVSRRTAVKAIAELQALGVLKIIPRRKSNGDDDTNWYKLWDEKPQYQKKVPSAGDALPLVQEMHPNYTHSNGTPTLEASDVLSNEDLEMIKRSKTPNQRTNQ